MVKVISLSEEAYALLKANKRDRSFSEVVIEFVPEKKKKSLMDFFGIWADRAEDVGKMKELIEEDRKKFKLRTYKL